MTPVMALHPSLRFLLAASPDPDTATLYLERLQSSHEDVFPELVQDESALRFLLAVFGNSRFLSEEVLLHPEWIEELAEREDLFRVRTAEEFTHDFDAFLRHVRPDKPALSLALFRRYGLLRILIRDVMGYATVAEVTEELSNLADAILDGMYRRIRADLVARYGTPRYTDAAGERCECGFSVLALGKLGGRELNYSSDIDLMFVYSGNGETDGENSISNKEFFKKVANLYTDALSTHTGAGLCYRVDLRLRPDGRLGEVCLSLDGTKQYYDTRARDWELQMLIKARVAAGEPEPGRELLAHVEPRIYASTLDFSAVESVSLTRERIHERAAARRGTDGAQDVKLTRGGIRDVEFLVQCLQRLHGGREPWVRHGGTLLALARLRDKDYLSESEYSRLAGAYEFLRQLEHRLQFVDDRQTHVLPTDAGEIDILARRMRTPRLLQDLNAHLENVQGLYERVIHAQQPLYYTSVAPPASDEQQAAPEQPPAPAAGNLIRFLDQRAPQLAGVLAKTPMRRIRAFEQFLESILDKEQIDALERDAELASDVIELFENSPYFSDELMRAPELIDQVHGGPAPIYSDALAMLATAADVRRFYRREMMRLQADSVCRSAPIFDTLARTSDLADAAICAAYRIAVEQVRHTTQPVATNYEPHDQMMVIALGRLGMREFDLGSDADLNFVLPDEDAGEVQFWSRVASRLIDVISAYTGEGVLFTVDTRLRPNGREGPLVQAAGGYKQYFANRAEAWEGISYMKARTVAGNVEAGTRFLGELQQVDWRRYGQSGRSRADLREMRARLETEQGEGNPLKAGVGGYYDIDFALMYLRLKSAGIFFKVLNTPERIDIIEKMGHLEREDAEFLRDAATLYRAIDHGLRVYSGHAEGHLPKSDAHLRTLTSLVQRWTPEHLHDQELPVELAQIRQGTREVFRRLFG